MNHPLTDELCDNIAPWPIQRLPGEYVSMRAVADWQLEQCVEELECLLSIFGTTGVIKEEAIPPLVALFKSNMRPQEDNQ